MSNQIQLKGKRLWRLRSHVMTDKIFADAAVLRDEAMKYFDWCDRNPWEKIELVKYKDYYEEANLPIGRPYTLDGLCIFLGVSDSYLRMAKRNCKTRIEQGKHKPEDPAIVDAIEWIESVVRNHQIEGSMVGVFNASLTARLQGLADNVVTTAESSVTVTVRDKKTADDLITLNDLL